MKEDIAKLWEVVKRHESRLRANNLEKVFSKIYKRKSQKLKQESTRYGLHLALCVNTRDPWKQNRVQYFSPVLDLPQENDSQGFGTRLSQCEWAWPISAMGGIDDSGLTWIPPAGSTVCLLFQNGSSKSAFYCGTTWQRDKGPENAQNWGFPVPEYDKVFKGHRKGYMVGKNDESQSFPPFHNDNYQGYDFDASVDEDLLIQTSQHETTWPHMYGMKTPEKHVIIMDDGDAKCNRRFKRIEIISSCGQQFLMKDDPYNNCGAWTNPKCQLPFVDVIPNVCEVSYIAYSNINFPDIAQIANAYACQQGAEYCSVIPEISWVVLPTGSDVSVITGTNSAPVEEEYLGTENFCPSTTMPTIIDSIPVDCMGVMKGLTDYCFSFNNVGKNRYQENRHECFPYLDNRCGLPQTGIQLLSRNGHGLVMDDSVETPRERPEWERTLKQADKDGCTGVYRGRMYLRSSTGHYIELNDTEVNPRIRGPKNGIILGTACGQYISINDHTEAPDIAGANRGIHMKSSSDHTFDMCDDGNQQASPERDGCGKTGPYSKKALVRLRSGYGIEIIMNDGQDQTKTDQQYLQLKAPQKDNLQRGPHILHMQEKATGSGQVFLRAGGDYIVYSYDNMVEVVGDEQDNPSNKLEFVSNMKIVSVKDVYYNKAKTHCFWAEDHIFLLAGQDAGIGGPTVFPVVVACQPIPEYVQQMTGMKASEHVFASARFSEVGCASDVDE